MKGDGELLDLADRVASWARDGEQVEAYASRSRDTDVRVFEGDVESLSSSESEGIGVRVVAGGRQGFAYAGTLDPSVLEEVLGEARDNAAFGAVDDCYGLPVPDGVAVADLDLFRPELGQFPTARKVELALELERATRAADARVRGVETAEYGDGMSESAIVTSEGIRATARRTVCSLVAYAIAGEGSETQTGFGYSVARRPDDLDVAAAAGDAAERATRLLGARQPASRRLTVVLEPRVTASLLGIVAGAIGGDAVVKGRSMFVDRLGEAVAVGSLTLVDDPTTPEAYGATPYDAEGLATRRNVVIDGGVLRSFLHNAYTGRRAGAGSTGSAVRGGFKSTPGAGARALSLVPGDRSPEELVAAVGDGVVVQSVTGLHSGANPVSGDFSVGVEGLMVRDGALAEPVREATIASTLQRMLKDVVAIGSDLEWLPGGAAGVTVVIGDVTLSGS
ncbi:MAG: TldD/PmbA family protein [Actinobacteria bacterium]|nr:MAG: TldD/PmbA family protein [Actinomycetota bacterium]